MQQHGVDHFVPIHETHNAVTFHIEPPTPITKAVLFAPVRY